MSAPSAGSGGRANQAIRRPISGPGAIEDAFQPPCAAAWGAPVAILQQFVSRPDANYQALAGAMGRMLNVEDECLF